MDLKSIQKKLSLLKSKIEKQGGLNEHDQKELQSLMTQTLSTASDELETLQIRLKNLAPSHKRVGNDNHILSEEQKSRLLILEKSGSCSGAIH